MILQFFLHVLGVPIMFEHKKVTEVLGNKIVDTIWFLNSVEGIYNYLYSFCIHLTIYIEKPSINLI